MRCKRWCDSRHRKVSLRKTVLFVIHEHRVIDGANIYLDMRDTSSATELMQFWESWRSWRPEHYDIDCFAWTVAVARLSLCNEYRLSWRSRERHGIVRLTWRQLIISCHQAAATRCCIKTPPGWIGLVAVGRVVGFALINDQCLTIRHVRR